MPKPIVGVSLKMYFGHERAAAWFAHEPDALLSVLDEAAGLAEAHA
jgi:hypothetical protein